ncbi:dTMP kinase [Paenibacillus hexagrammi]|uniref:Thymidylate kinase n=1 Tax=Paenibacillus hexagrammi TaxID=2908839 RepID=A0ABY3SKC6_9BACL|nr:deoxynucleoside kinase [Paenibacillus sp. YPD9-1]UJF34499.1 deoxynucleoside kinase [Paenibacillus sp. YPD9-1]
MDQEAFVVGRKKGLLLVYEGISGSGKSMGIRRLQHYLSTAGLETVTVEWNANPLIRSMVQKLRRYRLLTPWTYSLLQWIGFIIDYWTVISPALRKGRIVIADRYVYTAISRDAANEAGGMLARLLGRWFRQADILLFFDTHPEICLERIVARGKVLFHTNKQLQNQDLAYLQRMRDEYMKLFRMLRRKRRTNIIVVDSRQAPELVHHQIAAYMQEKAGIGRSADERTTSKGTTNKRTSKHENEHEYEYGVSKSTRTGTSTGMNKISKRTNASTSISSGKTMENMREVSAAWEGKDG